MAILTRDELSSHLFELSTVDIRSCLRWANNHIKDTVTPASLLSSMRHENAHRRLMADYSLDQAETALNRFKELSPHHTPAEPAPAPMPTDREALLRALLTPTPSEDVTNLKERMETLTDRFTGLLADVTGQGRTITDFTSRLDILEKNGLPKPLIIQFPNAEPKNLGLAHYLTPRLLRYLTQSLNVWMTGPAGSGKSTAAELVAKAMDLPFYATSVCAQTTETKFLGYMDATGQYRRTQFRDAYENGGVYLIDEVDNGNPNVLAVLNAALSGHWCAFPDKMVQRHQKFRCAAAANTWGQGKTIQYVGRNAIDAATLNRFVFLHWKYDEKLETAVAGLPEWSRYVQACRVEIERRGVNYLITPRASIYGAQALRGGTPINEILDDILFPNLDEAIREQMPKVPAISI